MEFVGPGLATFSLEEQAVLSNMAVECNALTAVMEPTEPMIRYLEERRGMARPDIEGRLVYPDPDSRVEATIGLDLGEIQTLVAAPGHPGNGVALDEVRGTAIDLGLRRLMHGGRPYFGVDVRTGARRTQGPGADFHPVRFRTRS